MEHSWLLTSDDKIGLRARDCVVAQFSSFRPVTFPQPSLFMLVLGREVHCSSGMGRDGYLIMRNVKTRIETSFSYSILYSNSNLKSVTDTVVCSPTDSCECDT